MNDEMFCLRVKQSEKCVSDSPTNTAVWMARRTNSSLQSYFKLLINKLYDLFYHRSFDAICGTELLDFFLYMQWFRFKKFYHDNLGR